MIYIIPGIFQIRNRKYVLGMFLFILTIVSISIFVKVNMFTLQQNLIIEYFSALLFVLAYIIHLLNIVFYKTAFNKIFTYKGNLYEKGRLALLKQNYELAILNFEALLKLKPEDEDVIYQLGKAYIDFEQNAKGIKFFKKYRNKLSKKWKFEIEAILEEINQDDT